MLQYCGGELLLLAGFQHDSTRAAVACLQGQYVAAIACYSEALAMDPQNFKALFNRGFSFDKAGDHDAAIRDYSAAIEVDPQNSFAFYNRGIAKDRKGDFQGAVADFTIAISLEPDNADFFHNRGFSLRKQVCTSHTCGIHSALITHSRSP